VSIFIFYFLNYYAEVNLQKKLKDKEMSKLFTVVLLFVLSSVLSINAHAWSLWEISGAKMDINGKDIRIASVNRRTDGFVYHSNDELVKKGVYLVVVASIPGTSPTQHVVLPNTTKLIRDYLNTRGVNIVDKLEGSGYAWQVSVANLAIDDANTQLTEIKAQSGSLGDHVLSVGGDVAGQELVKKTILPNAVVMPGSYSGLTSGGGHYEGTELTFTSIAISNATDEKLLNLDDITEGHLDEITARTAVKDSDPNTTKADLLTVLTKAWADIYFVKD
jgi:hypothetical protein